MKQHRCRGIVKREVFQSLNRCLAKANRVRCGKLTNPPVPFSCDISKSLRGLLFLCAKKESVTKEVQNVTDSKTIIKDNLCQSGGMTILLLHMFIEL